MDKLHHVKCGAYYDRMRGRTGKDRVPVLYYERPDPATGDAELRLWLTKIGSRLIAVDDAGGEYPNEVDSGFLYGTRIGADDLPDMPVVQLIAKWKAFRRTWREDHRKDVRAGLSEP